MSLEECVSIDLDNMFENNNNNIPFSKQSRICSMIDFIEKNPYPTHEKILEEIHKNDGHIPTNKFWMLMKYYNRSNHEIVKQIYENIYNNSFLYIQGKKLLEMNNNNIDVLKVVYYVISNLTELNTNMNKQLFISGLLNVWEFFLEKV